MPKRKQVETVDSAEPSSPESPNDEDTTAKKLVSDQKEQQKRRRSKSHTPGSRARTSVWTTHAARRVDGDKPQFLCNVCNEEISTNHSYSSSNVTLHFKNYHKGAFEVLQRLNEQNATDYMLSTAIQDAQNVHQRKKASVRSIDSFFRPKNAGSSAQGSQTVSAGVSPKLLQAITLVLYSCVTETSPMIVCSPITQALVNMFDGRMQYSSKDVFDSYLLPTYRAVCDLLQTVATCALTGSLTLDGWSAALGAPILGITWHFIDDSWRLCSIPITTLNTGTASKSAEQLRSIVDCVLKNSTIIGSDKISIHTITSDNEPSVALGVDLLTNYVGSVRCVVHTLALCVNDVFSDDAPWQRYMDVVNNVTKYFNYHGKAYSLLKEKQMDSGVTPDRIRRLKHDIPTRWHSRLGAMLNYITEFDNICKVAEELDISSDDLPSMNREELNVLADVIHVLAEVRRVARQLEADRAVTMSRTPRLIRELYETLMVMSGKMTSSDEQFFNETNGSGTLDTSAGSSVSSNVPSPSIPSTADHCKERDQARSHPIAKRVAQDLAEAIAERVSDRLGFIWSPVDARIANWRPDDNDGLNTEMRASRRVLLFHISAFLDINECALECLQCSRDDLSAYYETLCAAVAREATELDGNMPFDTEDLRFMMRILNKQMKSELRNSGRRFPNYALHYWKKCNQDASAMGPVAFNKIAKAALSSQASSASAERLFSDLGRLEGRERQSLLSSSLEMTATIRNYVNMRLKDADGIQTGLLHPQGVAFKRTCNLVASKVARMH